MSYEQAASHKKRPGIWLMAIGGLIAAGFAIYALLASPDSSPGPLWIVVGWGVLVFLYGLYRAVKGPSSLDHRRGGTDANGR
ncbi:hypothetical protein [Glutamicibacter protophormiae]|uniref:hypothetical protein n=1 Tax=Glutamicibacter protophormiae TaxID=37930 RepID=UPI00195C7261|nr:hypothetical protein [Glutamicibacter protophormiae]QRQ78307.1 hypothetical protein JQN66_15565 [Glutamicibacter protophormiae]